MVTYLAIVLNFFAVIVYTVSVVCKVVRNKSAYRAPKYGTCEILGDCPVHASDICDRYNEDELFTPLVPVSIKAEMGENMLSKPTTPDRSEKTINK